MTMHYAHVEDERVRAGLERVVDRASRKQPSWAQWTVSYRSPAPESSSATWRAELPPVSGITEFRKI